MAPVCTTQSPHKPHWEKRGTKIGFILHKNVVKTFLHINLLKQGDNVYISQIVQNIDQKKIIFMSDLYPPFASLFEPTTKANAECSPSLLLQVK